MSRVAVEHGVDPEQLRNRSGEGSEVPLCVDLDGTLLRSDMLQESLCAMLRQHPLLVFLLFFWLLRGRAFLKRRIAEHVLCDTSRVPVHEEVLAWLRQEKAKGRTLVLATASEVALARAIADRVGVFDEVVASEGTVNVSGKNKARVLQERYPQGFDYVGNAPVDFKVWRHSRRVYAVSTNPLFLKVVRRVFPDAITMYQSGLNLKTFVRAIRVHQWVKNLLLFVPAIMAHRVADLAMWQSSVLAFISFGLCASSVYLLNDLVDLDADRQHHSKCRRPIAAGHFPIALALWLIPVFLGASVLLAQFLPFEFFAILCLYFTLTLGYSLQLKRVVLLDILLLAGLYTLRIVAGGLAVGVPVSEWLLGFSMFLFLSLACVKRYSELYVLRRDRKERSAGRGYEAGDLEQIANFGSTSGYLSVLVLALYISSDQVRELYTHPQLLWLACPVLLYWVSRVWLLAHRGQLHEDPIVFALTDRVSYVAGAIAAAVLVLAV